MWRTKRGGGEGGGILSSSKLEEYEYELFARAFSTRIDRVSFVEGRGIFLERGIGRRDAGRDRFPREMTRKKVLFHDGKKKNGEGGTRRKGGSRLVGRVTVGRASPRLPASSGIVGPVSS